MSQLGFRPLYVRTVAIGIVLACVPPLLKLPAWVTVVGALCIVSGAAGGAIALIRDNR